MEVSAPEITVPVANLTGGAEIEKEKEGDGLAHGAPAPEAAPEPKEAARFVTDRNIKVAVVVALPANAAGFKDMGNQFEKICVLAGSHDKVLAHPRAHITPDGKKSGLVEARIALDPDKYQAELAALFARTGVYDNGVGNADKVLVLDTADACRAAVHELAAVQAITGGYSSMQITVDLDPKRLFGYGDFGDKFLVGISVGAIPFADRLDAVAKSEYGKAKYFAVRPSRQTSAESQGARMRAS